MAMYYGGNPIPVKEENISNGDLKTKIKMKISFMLYNPTLKPPKEFKHDEDKCQSAKILMFYPDYLNEHEKRKQAGLCEGVIEFMKAFVMDHDNYHDNPIETINTSLFTLCIKE